MSSKCLLKSTGHLLKFSSVTECKKLVQIEKMSAKNNVFTTLEIYKQSPYNMYKFRYNTAHVSVGAGAEIRRGFCFVFFDGCLGKAADSIADRFPKLVNQPRKYLRFL